MEPCGIPLISSSSDVVPVKTSVTDNTNQSYDKFMRHKCKQHMNR